MTKKNTLEISMDDIDAMIELAKKNPGMHELLEKAIVFYKLAAHAKSPEDLDELANMKKLAAEWVKQNRIHKQNSAALTAAHKNINHKRK